MSTTTQTLIEEIKAAPEYPAGGVRLPYFSDNPQSVRAEGAEDLLPLAQTAWAADWNTPAEVEAWRNL